MEYSILLVCIRVAASGVQFILLVCIRVNMCGVQYPIGSCVMFFILHYIKNLHAGFTIKLLSKCGFHIKYMVACDCIVYVYKFKVESFL